MSTIEIYGTSVTIPEYDGYVEDWGTDISAEQYWRRIPLYHNHAMILQG